MLTASMRTSLRIAKRAVAERAANLFTEEPSTRAREQPNDRRSDSDNHVTRSSPVTAAAAVPHSGHRPGVARRS